MKMMMTSTSESSYLATSTDLLNEICTQLERFEGELSMHVPLPFWLYTNNKSKSIQTITI